MRNAHKEAGNALIPGLAPRTEPLYPARNSKTGLWTVFKKRNDDTRPPFQIVPFMVSVDEGQDTSRVTLLCVLMLGRLRDSVRSCGRD